jgi:hypothetical protein
VAVKQVAALSGAMSDEIGLAMGRADLGVRGMAIGNRGLGTFATVPAVSNVNTYNVTVNTAATSGTYLADVMLARALAGSGDRWLVRGISWSRRLGQTWW